MPVPFRYVLATGVVLGLIIGFKSFIPFLYWGETADYNWYKSALPQIINYIFWPILVPFIYWTFQRFKIMPGASARDRLATVVMSLLVPFVHELVTTTIYFIILEYTDTHHFTAETFERIVAVFHSVYIGRIVEYWIIYGLFAAFDYYRKYKNKQAELGRIEAELNRTKLAVLKMQLQPHFLFNALNSISSLMDMDVKKAQTVTAQLGDLLRGILEQDQRIFISIEEEIQYVKSYLEIEKIRFEDRLTIRYNIDPAIIQMQIPMLLVQPLVENAIKHAVAKQSGNSMIKITVKDGRTGELKIKVSDNGPGQSHSSGELLNQGVGLSNIKARLERLYKGKAQLNIETSKNAGFMVEIIIPKIEYHEKGSDGHRG